MSNKSIVNRKLIQKQKFCQKRSPTEYFEKDCEMKLSDILWFFYKQKDRVK